MTAAAIASAAAPERPEEVASHAHAFVDPGFERRLIEATRPIAEHYLAFALHHLFESGAFDLLAQADGAAIAFAADALGLDEHRLRGLLLFLANEGVVTVEDDAVALTAKGRLYGEFRPWYTMMIGGYAPTLGQIGNALVRGAPACTRDGRYVGLGSCQVARFDGMPITRTLLSRAGVDCREILDLGCGNGLYLVDFCRDLPGVRAWGAEPDRGGYEEALELVERSGLSDRIRMRQCSATEFLRDPPAACDPDLIVFGYVLHEVLEQEGEQGVVELLRAVADRFPRINVVVIEVANAIDDPGVMRHGLATNFWNPYFLIHYFTPQRLERRSFWERVFALAGLDVVDLITTDPAVDSTGLELGYLLRKAPR
jgi:2-ketoarginine methyltransferase